MSARGLVAAAQRPTAAGASAIQRNPDTNRVAHRSAATKNVSALVPKAGTITTDPAMPATHSERVSTAWTAQPITVQIGRSSPNGNATTPITAAGMTTKETSGSVTAFPITP